MARPLRIQYPGAYYHVMNRGNSRQEIFLSGLAESGDIFGVRIIAHVLMPNHFHLILQTEQANLSEFMRHFLVSYTVRINRKWGRSGHVFQGRYKSLLIDKDAYLGNRG
jgi:REP element-mobilizing transposase RayT